ncbi:MAG: hypothetical protein QG564_623 [Campylobacterota bacterium]|nr:hypothetical protein [Campylobacterota bacterium]
MLRKNFLALSFLLSLCNADNNQKAETKSHYIDEAHVNFSNKILEWSTLIDTKLSQWLSDSDNNTSAIESKISNNSISSEIESMDSFFQNKKFLDESDNTYVRLRLDSNFQSKESNNLGLKLSAQLPLSKSKKKFKIFIDDLTEDNAKDLLQDSLKEKYSSSDIGIHYFTPPSHGIASRYSLGISGIDPFVRARYTMPMKIDSWLIDPIQSFQYSSENEFEEETDIYFDKKLKELSFFRIQLHRKTESEIEGMDYGLALQYYASPKKDTGFSLSQSFEGNTEYHYVSDKNLDSKKIKTFRGINNYTTSLRWRESVWRKWFFYEVGPAVNFHRQYDYKPNYSVHFMVDFYFGNRR